MTRGLGKCETCQNQLGTLVYRYRKFRASYCSIQCGIRYLEKHDVGCNTPVRGTIRFRGLASSNRLGGTGYGGADLHTLGGANEP